MVCGEKKSLNILLENSELTSGKEGGSACKCSSQFEREGDWNSSGDLKGFRDMKGCSSPRDGWMIHRRLVDRLLGKRGVNEC